MGQKNPKTSILHPLIFDTDVGVWMLRKHPEALDFARSVEPYERNLSVVSYLELLRGCRNAREARDLGELVEDWFSEVVSLTPSISQSTVGLMKQFAFARHPGVDDLLIGATALERHEAVATGNVKHFDFIPGLLVRAFRPQHRRGY